MRSSDHSLFARNTIDYDVPAMSNPIVIGYHLIWTAYGWWLPNDPRGSMSNQIRNDLISDLGQIHFGRKKIQPASRAIRDFYEEAKGCLKHPLLIFSPSDTLDDIRRTVEYVE